MGATIDTAFIVFIVILVEFLILLAVLFVLKSKLPTRTEVVKVSSKGMKKGFTDKKTLQFVNFEVLNSGRIITVPIPKNMFEQFSIGKQYKVEFVWSGNATWLINAYEEFIPRQEREDRTISQTLRDKYLRR